MSFAKQLMDTRRFPGDADARSGFNWLGIMLLVAMVGSLSACADNSNDAARKQIGQTYADIGPLKTDLAVELITRGQFPTGASARKLLGGSDTKTYTFADVTLDADQEAIVVTFNDQAVSKIRGGSLLFKYEIVQTEQGRRSGFACSTPDLEFNILPSKCRNR